MNDKQNEQLREDEPLRSFRVAWDSQRGQYINPERKLRKQRAAERERTRKARAIAGSQKHA